jgi:hypothetical protein
MTSDLTHSDKLGRRVRTGPPTSLGVSTYELIVDAVRAGDRATAADYVSYAVEEASRIFFVFTTWLDAMLRYGEAEVADFSDRLTAVERTLGAPPPLIDEPADVGRAEVAAAGEAVRLGDAAAVERALAALREAQMGVHDLQADWCWGLLTVFRDALGEERVEEVLRITQAPWLAERYARYADMTPEESLQLTVEGMRGHLTGPGRKGTVDVRDAGDRWVLSFDPCGSGGRMRRGDPERGQAPRTEPPYEFGVTEEAHPWSWGEKGVCLYCAHCAVVNEILPIEATGAPMRVVDYPADPGAPCRWTVYKSPELVPDEAYARVGKEPPPRRSTSATEAR